MRLPKKLRINGIIYNIVREFQPLPTEQSEKLGLAQYISGGSVGRYLRWLQERGLIIGERKEGKKTKIWRLK